MCSHVTGSGDVMRSRDLGVKPLSGFRVIRAKKGDRVSFQHV